MTRRIAVGVLLALAVLSGCDSPPARTPAEPPVSAIPVVRTPEHLADLKLPLDEYIETPASRKDVDRAINLLGRKCMRELGLDWSVTGADAAPVRDQHQRRYGIIDARYGYHPPPAPAEVRPPDQWASLSADQAAAWTGQQSTVRGAKVPEGGCAAEAARTLTAGAPSLPPVRPQLLANEALALATKDSRVLATFGRWSECVRRSGLNYGSPWEINDDPKWHQSPQPTEPELAAARADVACRQEINLVGVWYAVERGYQQRMMRQHTAELAALGQVIKVQREAAARVIAGTAN